MLAESFRLGSGRVLPGGGSGKRALHALAASILASGLVLCLTSCGSSGTSGEERLVDGNGFTFKAPASWDETRRAAMITVSPGKDAPELVGVSIFRLVKPYKTSLFPRVVPELNGVAKKLAGGRGGGGGGARAGARGRPEGGE